MQSRKPDERPQRGHTMVTAGLDPRWMTSSQTPDPNGVAHNQAVELAFLLLCDPVGVDVL